MNRQQLMDMDTVCPDPRKEVAQGLCRIQREGEERARVQYYIYPRMLLLTYLATSRWHTLSLDALQGMNILR